MTGILNNMPLSPGLAIIGAIVGGLFLGWFLCWWNALVAALRAIEEAS